MGNISQYAEELGDVNRCKAGDEEKLRMRSRIDIR